MKTNLRTKPTFITTHEGGRAAHVKPVEQLKRSVLSCMLWENAFYEDGEEIGERIRALIPKVPAADCVRIALDARKLHHLRHVPLWVAVGMCHIIGVAPYRNGIGERDGWVRIDGFSENALGYIRESEVQDRG